MSKTLFISDFDDTLVTTQANIIVTTADGEVKKLTPAEYAVYEKSPGDDFDYREFDELINPEPIPRYVRLLKRALASSKVDKVVILTARGSEKPVAAFLKSVGITTGLKIVPLGDSDPERKKEYIRRQIQKGFTRVAFADDSPKNVVAAKELRNEFPDAKLVVHHVEPHSPKAQRGKPVKPKKSAHKKVQQVLNKRIRNPKTGNNVLIKTILQYGKEHPAYQQAVQMLQKNT
jgi:hypothetical protein